MSIIALLCVGAACAILSKRSGGIQLLDFSQKLDGEAAAFSFQLDNPSAQPLTAVVTVRAENAREGHEGLQLWHLGTTNIQVKLGAHERKKMVGSIYIGHAGGAYTVLSHSFRVEPLGTAGSHR